MYLIGFICVLSIILINFKMWKLLKMLVLLIQTTLKLLIPFKRFNQNLICIVMKNLFTFLFVLLTIGFTGNSKAQTLSTVTASAGATIIVPMTLTEQNSLNFGTTNKQSGVAGSVVLSTSDASRDFSGGVSGSLIGDPASNAIFNITGAYDSSYAITLPSSITVMETGSMAMTINELKIRFSGGSADIAITEGNNSINKVLNGNGNDSFSLGGKLNIESEQVAGIYSGTYSVTVDYN